MSWNPRFVAYAQSQKCTPKEVIKLDAERWPGGKMTGFTLWIDEQWAGWLQANPQVPAKLPRTVEDHANFDRWLAGRRRAPQEDRP